MRALLRDLERRSSSQRGEVLSSLQCEASLQAAKVFISRWQTSASLPLEPSPFVLKRAERLRTQKVQLL